MVIPDFRGEFQIGAKECGAKFGNQFFTGVTFITETLAAKAAIQTVWMACPVGELVCECCVVAFR